MNELSSALTAALRILLTNGWFAERSPEVQSRLAAIARLRQFAANEAVYLAGDPPNGVFGLVTGSLNVSFPRTDGEDYVMHRAGSGFWLGDLALLSHKSRLVSIHSAEPTTMVQLPASEIAVLMQDDPRLYAEFYALTYENFQTAFKIITNLSIQAVDQRVADRLLLESAAWPNSGDWIALSQPELARLVALSLPTLQRIMRRFADEGLVKRGYGRIKVLDRDALRRICSA